MLVSLVDGIEEIATLDKDEAKLCEYNLRQNIGMHVDDDPVTFFDKKLKTLTINGRCLVSIKDTEHLGVVRFKRKVHSKEGVFVGIELDEPIGNSNGVYV